ncbi:MAG: DNA polymerase IV [Proteobacteria bacterium]|nr:DNA polymerase IV [Pseudomonadota bacterium]
MEPRSPDNQPEPWIIHVDMDAFFAAVEVLDRPELAGLPLVVGGPENRGVVCSASYPARAFGVRSAMPTAEARRLCPHAVFLPVRHKRYGEISRQVFSIFADFTPLVEPLSVDEAFLDVTGCQRLFGPPEEIARQIRARIRAEVGLTASAGVAPVKLAAKIASDLCKPDGLLKVPAGGVAEFLAPLPMGRLWGVGPAAQKELAKLGVKTIGDIARLDPEGLKRRFGKFGETMVRHARGLDDRVVHPPEAAKSVGREETFLQDVRDPAQARRHILDLSGRVARRLRRHGVKGRTVTLKVKYADFSLITRSATLDRATDDGGEINAAALSLLKKTQVGTRPVRLLGVSVSSLLTPGQASQELLFDQETRRRKASLNLALDQIADRYGEQTVLPAALVEKD